MRALLLAASLSLLSCGSPVTLAAFGDSLTSGRDWIDHLPAHWTGLDFGNPGEECWNAVGPRARTAYPSLQADVVVLFCGTNDVRKTHWSVARSMVEIESAARQAQAYGFDVVLVAPPPIFRDGGGMTYPLFNARLMALRAAVFELGNEIDAPVADTWSVFWWQDQPQELYKDGVHPNRDGRWLVSAAIQLAILQL